ncbi:hypothetical protein E4U21_002807 [Claviceps maximensis]|nr:hypothetical protein E4U21_002807 [Claviceps maximensis]
MYSVRRPTQHFIASLPDLNQSPSSVSYSCYSSLSSARPSDLSGTYMLSRTDAVSPSRFPGAVVDSAREIDGMDRMDSLNTMEQDSSTPTIAYFPPSPSASKLSVNTYDSQYSTNPLDYQFADEYELPILEDEQAEAQRLFTPEDCAIPPVLCPYYGAEPTDPPLRPSDPRSFRYLFPSKDGLSIRHDDTTPDGNMNLRVDTVAWGIGGSNGAYDGPMTVQLFHLRMHDLVKRHFSLRRYCRDSGREVCFSKREYTSTSSNSQKQRKEHQQQQQQHGIQRSVSSALRYVTAPFHRTNALRASCFSLKSPSLSTSRPSTIASAITGTSSVSSKSSGASPTTDFGFDGPSDESARARLTTSSKPKSLPPSLLLTPTNNIKLEFGNYARVQVARRSSKRYRFEWWGHTYTWKRTVNKHLNTFSFHLRRHDSRHVLAYIEQERQSRIQIDVEKRAGGWVPPCYMWFQWSVITGPKDVAE